MNGWKNVTKQNGDDRIKKNERGKNDPVEGPRFRTRGRLFKKNRNTPSSNSKENLLTIVTFI